MSQGKDLLTAEEDAKVESLLAIMDGNLSPEVALKLLRKHNGDVQKAASALFEVDLGETNVKMDVSETGRPPLVRSDALHEPDKGQSVIDLTADDEDGQLSRALQASLEDQGPKFGPSNRAPDPAWAVVPSNVEANVGMSQDDQSLSRAIEESLRQDHGNDVFEELPLIERVRRDGRPVALRPTEGSLTPAALIIHALFFVPQVRHAIARWRPWQEGAEDTDQESAFTRGPPTNGPDHMIWTLMETFANMDIAQMSELSVDAAIDAFKAEQWSTAVERPGDVSFQFYSKLVDTIENCLYREPPPGVSPAAIHRIFHFRYGSSDADISELSFDSKIDPSVVKVDIRGTEDTNDLVSCLSEELGLDGSASDPARQQVIFVPSDVVAFQLVRDNSPPSYSASTSSWKSTRTDRTTFRYPRYVYLDQFLKGNIGLANEKSQKRRQLYAEVDRLIAKKESLTQHKDRDTLADLRSSLHYYEEVAEHNDEPERKTTIQDTALKLRKILTKIENELQTIDTTITKLKHEATHAFDCPELQQHRYDLRAVLVHDGLYGRSHIYSYVKQKDTWWKTVDYSVTEVSEATVLNDPAGLHLGAGPYLLIYSRALHEEEGNMRASWPEGLKDSIKHNNRMFLSQLPASAAAHVLDPNSPPSSPYHSTTPSEYTISSGTVEPPLSREEPMDIVD